MYLLQLVQALRFEQQDTMYSGVIRTRSNRNPTDEKPSDLAAFLIERSALNSTLGTFFHWYIIVECEDPDVNKMYTKVAWYFMKRLMEVCANRPSGESLTLQASGRL